MHKGYVASKSKSTKFLLCVAGLSLAAATRYGAALSPVSAQAVPGTTVRTFSIVAVGPHNISLGSARGQWVNPAGAASSVDSTGSFHMEVRGAALNITRNAGTARVTTSIQTEATARSVLITTTSRVGTVTYSSGSITKTFPRDADALGRIVFPFGPVTPVPTATPRPTVTPAATVTPAPAFNTVVISDVASGSVVNRSSFVPTDRAVGVSSSGVGIRLGQLNSSGMLRTIELSLPAAPQIGRLYPLSPENSASTAQFYYQEAVGDRTTVWNSVRGFVVVDSITGPIYRFRIINARMGGGLAGTTDDMFTLNFNGTATQS